MKSADIEVSLLLQYNESEDRNLQVILMALFNLYGYPEVL